MAFETGSASSLTDLIAKVLTFSTANGWTQDENDTVNGHVGLHKGATVTGNWISMAYVTSGAEAFSLHQATAWVNAATDPGSHTEDSGNGYNGGAISLSNIRLERHVDLNGVGPYPTYWAFGDSAQSYIHVVVEASSGSFRHFGFGDLTKTGDWDGGQYCYGHDKGTIAGAKRTEDTFLLDGMFNIGGSSRKAATLRMKSLPEQPAAERWGQVWGATTAPPTDTLGGTKAAVQGGFRAGPAAELFGSMGGFTSSVGLTNMYPINAYYRQPTSSFVRFLGTMPDVRGVNNRFFTPGQKITIGADTWYVFPAQAKGESTPTDSTYYMGIAYKVV